MPKPTIAPALIHGFIDPYAPGGLEQLFAFRRAQFGDAVMSAAGGEGGAGAGTGGAGPAGSGGAGAGTGGAGSSGDETNGAGGAAGTAGSGSGPAGDEPLGEGGKRALEAERAAVRQLRADLAERDAKITGFENANLTDAEKREKELKELQANGQTSATQLASSQLTVLQYQVAAAKGLDLEAAERLRGATKEELESDADAWILKWGKSTGNGVVPGAGTGGSSTVDVAPGMARLRLGYSEASKK